MFPRKSAAIYPPPNTPTLASLDVTEDNVITPLTINQHPTFLPQEQLDSNPHI